MNKIYYPFKVLWAWWFFFLFGLIFFFLYPLFWLWLRNEKDYPKANRLRRVWAWLLFLFSGVIYSIRYESRLNKKQAYIFCPNHFSYLDIPMFVMCFSGNYRFMAKAELNNVPFFNIFFRTIDIPVNRSSTTESVRALKEAGESLDKGNHLVIFPEGTIAHHPPHLNRFKNGPFRLAIEKQVPIVPVTFLDNWKMLYVEGKKYGRPGVTRAIVHKPVSTKGMTLDDVEMLKEKVHNIIDKTLKAHESR